MDVEINKDETFTEIAKEKSSSDDYVEENNNILYEENMSEVTSDLSNQENNSKVDNIDKTSEELETVVENIPKDKEEEKIDEPEILDILGNGLLTKKVLKKGLGRETRPSHGDSVTISYKGYNSKNEEIEQEDDVSFVVGDADMIQAFDLAICLAEKLEEFEIKTDARFAYGSLGNLPTVNPNESLTYHIKLTTVDDPPDYSTFKYDDRLSVADKKRQRGNYFYRREDFSLAVNIYSKALKIINSDPDFKNLSTDPTKDELFDIFIKIKSNLAAAQLKLQCYESVIETCDSILLYQPENVKALFRKGKSLSQRAQYADAISVLKKCLELDNSKLIANELQNCYTLKKNAVEQQARICRRMFGGGDNGDNQNSDKTRKNQSNKSMLSTGISLMYKYCPVVIVVGLSIAAFHLYKQKPA